MIEIAASALVRLLAMTLPIVIASERKRSEAISRITVWLTAPRDERGWLGDELRRVPQRR